MIRAKTRSAGDASKNRGAETAQEARKQVAATRSTSGPARCETYNRPDRVGPGVHRGTVATTTTITEPSQKVDPLSESGH